MASRFSKLLMKYRISQLLSALPEKYRPAARFVIIFNLLALPMYLMILFDIQVSQFVSLTEYLARSLLSATGMEFQVVNNLIILPIENGTWAAFINWDCTGWKSLYALFALIVASPFSPRKKAFGLLLLPALYAVNILRIWFMFYVASVNIEMFPFVHAVVWSWGLVAAVLLLWVFWMKFFPER